MRTILIFSAAILLLISFVSAQTFQDSTLKMYPGDSSTISVILQNNNMQNAVFKAIILDGHGIVSLQSDTYNVPEHSETPASLNINIPSTAVPGTVYPIKVSFTSVTSSGKTLTPGLGIQASANILVISNQQTQVEQPAPALSDNSLAIISAIILVILIWAELTQRHLAKHARKRRK